jgi:hypothetical protein
MFYNWLRIFHFFVYNKLTKRFSSSTMKKLETLCHKKFMTPKIHTTQNTFDKSKTRKNIVMYNEYVVVER